MACDGTSQSPARHYTVRSSEVLELCQSLQREELHVLESIYPEQCISSQLNLTHLLLEIPVEFEATRCIEFIADVSPHHGWRLSVSILPPIVLDIILPASYPLKEPPTIASIKAAHEWVSDTLPLQHALAKMWTSEETILYQWIEYIRTGGFLQGLESSSNPLEILHHSPSKLVSTLSAYQDSVLFARFSKGTYLCGICLEHHKGSKCAQLLCDHVFCLSCLKDFWGICISEGDINRVGCPSPNCVKEGRKSSQVEVSGIVPEEQLERWKWLIQKQRLESDPTIMNCPIPTCQALIVKPTGVDPSSGWDRFRQCPDCGFIFCSYCKYTWHGPISTCSLPFTDRIFAEYMGAAEGSSTRILLESRYGAANFRRLRKEKKVEKATLEWFTASTAVCPGCQIRIEKIEGCNHMTCTRCSQHFCYRCQCKLDASNPYKHFSVPGTFCYGKLHATDDDMTRNGDWLYGD